MFASFADGQTMRTVTLKAFVNLQVRIGNPAQVTWKHC